MVVAVSLSLMRSQASFFVCLFSSVCAAAAHESLSTEEDESKFPVLGAIGVSFTFLLIVIGYIQFSVTNGRDSRLKQFSMYLKHSNNLLNNDTYMSFIDRFYFVYEIKDLLSEEIISNLMRGLDSIEDIEEVFREKSFAELNINLSQLIINNYAQFKKHLDQFWRKISVCRSTAFPFDRVREKEAGELEIINKVEIGTSGLINRINELNICTNLGTPSQDDKLARKNETLMHLRRMQVILSKHYALVADHYFLSKDDFNKVSFFLQKTMTCVEASIKFSSWGAPSLGFGLYQFCDVILDAVMFVEDPFKKQIFIDQMIHTALRVRSGLLSEDVAYKRFSEPLIELMDLKAFKKYKKASLLTFKKSFTCGVALYIAESSIFLDFATRMAEIRLWRDGLINRAWCSWYAAAPCCIYSNGSKKKREGDFSSRYRFN